jgi:hypothetical protein
MANNHNTTRRRRQQSPGPATGLRFNAATAAVIAVLAWVPWVPMQAAASQCSIETIAPAVYASAARQLLRPAPTDTETAISTEASAAWRLRAFVPTRVSFGRTEGLNLGLGEALGTTGGLSERASAGLSAGWSVRVIWDLRPLVAPPDVRRSARPANNTAAVQLEHALRRERWLDKIAGGRARLELLALHAAEVDSEDPRCAELGIEANARRWAMFAALGIKPPLPRASEQPVPRSGAARPRDRVRPP